MRNALLLQALTGVAAAQHMTLPFVDNAAVIAAINPSDPAYKICSAINEKLQGCADQAGGLGGLTTAALAELSKCACCVGGSRIAGDYSTCSSYLAQQAPTLSVQYSAYGNLYSLCNLNSRACTGNGIVSPTSGAATIPSISGSPDASGTGVSGSPPPGVTAAASLSSADPACSSMYGMYLSCSKNVLGFKDQPYGLQAPCYCCVTAQGQASWTDGLDKYAQTCKDWASSNGVTSIYDVAKTFTGFCKNFSNACNATSTLGSSEATATSTDVQTTGNSDSTVTTNTASHTTPTTTKASPTSAGAALNLHIGSAASLIAAVVIAFAF